MIIEPLDLVELHGFDPTSFNVLTQRSDHLVARVETDQGTVVLKASTTSRALERDATNAALLSAAGLPTPEVIARGESPISYILLRWIEGEALSSSSPIQAQMEAGALLRQIHDLGGRPPYGGNPTWDRWMKGWLNVALPWWEEHGGADPKSVEAAWAAFEELRPLLATRGHHFMLFDGRPAHFIVREGRIVGLIDVHDAAAGDGGMDLGVMGVLDEGLLGNVRKGYREDSDERAALDQLIPFYVFLRRVAAAEWHGRFGPREVAERALSLANANPYRTGS